MHFIHSFEAKFNLAVVTVAAIKQKHSTLDLLLATAAFFFFFFFTLKSLIGYFCISTCWWLLHCLHTPLGWWFCCFLLLLFYSDSYHQHRTTAATAEKDSQHWQTLHLLKSSRATVETEKRPRNHRWRWRLGRSPSTDRMSTDELVCIAANRYFIVSHSGSPKTKAATAALSFALWTIYCFPSFNSFVSEYLV